ncbi:hypothetical protein [Staphylococcus hominis]|uniref:hypothetical protein n=1 Tax=Staphylococcus hominis TaxID=1290 RepID=UPI0011A3B92E|nr:hypothetical protein [Staphylococcus hominis]MDS3904215.1 hypothetical protein [Staphylococcus hominis]
MSLTEYYLHREYENILNEIETLLFINQLRRQWRTTTRKQFMNKYNLFEGIGVREIRESLYEADIKKFNTHINNLNLYTKIKSINNEKVFQNDPIINEYQLKSLIALKLGRTDLSYTIKSIEEIKKLNRYQKKLTYKINSMNKESIKNSSKNKQIVSEKNKMSYHETLDIYNYYMEEALEYPNIVDKVESIFQIQEDNGFILFTELCKFIRKTLDFNSSLSYQKRANKQEREALFIELKLQLANVPLPLARIQLIRRVTEYFEIHNFNTLTEFIKTILPEINNIISTLITLVVETQSELDEILCKSMFIYLQTKYLKIKDNCKLNIHGPLRWEDSIYNDMLSILIETNFENIRSIITQKSFLDNDFKYNDIKTFNNINKETIVDIIL